MPQLVLTVGLPGSGKSTWARKWVAEDPAGRARVNRDDLRAMLRGELVWRDPDLEAQVTVAQHAAVAALLGAGVSVVVDDTNLAPERLDLLARIGQDAGAQVVIHRMTTPIEECIRRDALRPAGQRVGEAVIREMARAAATEAVAELFRRELPLD